MILKLKKLPVILIILLIWIGIFLLETLLSFLVDKKLETLSIQTGSVLAISGFVICVVYYYLLSKFTIFFFKKSIKKQFLLFLLSFLISSILITSMSFFFETFYFANNFNQIEISDLYFVILDFTILYLNQSRYLLFCFLSIHTYKLSNYKIKELLKQYEINKELNLIKNKSLKLLIYSKLSNKVFNVVKKKIINDEKLARSIIDNYSELLRIQLSYNSNEFQTLSDEINFIKKLLRIINLIEDNNIEFKLNIDKNIDCEEIIIKYGILHYLLDEFTNHIKSDLNLTVTQNQNNLYISLVFQAKQLTNFNYKIKNKDYPDCKFSVILQNSNINIFIEQNTTIKS